MGFRPLQSIKNEWREAREAGRELVVFSKTHNWKKSARKTVERKYWIWWIVGIILTAALVLISIYRDTILQWFGPKRQDILDRQWTIVVPIIVLIVLSIPPLGGHEIVLLVVGFIWGLGYGSAIACAGTLIGEWICFLGFKYLFTKKAQEIENESVFYACIARLMRDGGLWIIIVVRFSAVPGHVVTAVQSTVGMSIWVYSLAVIASLPKQIVVVYLGVMFGQSNKADPESKKKERIISITVFFVTGLATVLALYIVYMRARKLYPQVLQDSNDRKLAKGDLPDRDPTSSSEVVRVRSSLAEAAFDGDRTGPFGDSHAYQGPGGHSNYAASLPLPNSPEQGGMSPREHTIQMAPLQAGGGHWQDGRQRGERGWSEVEEQERRREEERRRIYGDKLADGADASTTRFAKLPLEGSEADAGHYGNAR